MEENKKRTAAMKKIRKLIAETKGIDPEEMEFENEWKITELKREEREEMPKRSDRKISRIYEQQKYKEGMED